MTQEERRQEVICSCLQQQEQIALIAKQEMDSAQQQSNDYGANVDRYDSFRTKMMRSRDMYAKQYSNAQAGIRCLQDMLRMAPPEVAECGACVVTDQQHFLISIGAGKFMVRNEVWFAISAQTPICIALKGKRVGESIFINGQTQTIREIF